jgi:hypothetical protein
MSGYSKGHAVNQLTDCLEPNDPAVYTCKLWTELERAAFIQALDDVHDVFGLNE